MQVVSSARDAPNKARESIGYALFVRHQVPQNIVVLAKGITSR